jgi:hypothetical protein
MRREQNLSLLPQAEDRMFAPKKDTYIDLAIALLTHYSFDLGGYKATELVMHWQNQFPFNWLHLAVVEALYQGRYKAVSAQQILTMWQRRGQPTFHFNMEFERLICSKFPESLTALPSIATTPMLPTVSSEPANNSYLLPPANSVPEKTDTSNTRRQYSKYEYKQKPVDEIVESNSIPKPAIANIQVEELDLQSRVASQLTKLLPPATNHPPIGQFTPERSKNSDSFASKLKAIVREEKLE